MRNKNIDVIKGIGIILIVAGHALSPYSIWFSSWFVQIFFIAAGYTYQERYADAWGGVKRLVLKRVRRLYVPWLITGSVITCMNNLLIKMNILTDNPLFLEAAEGNSYGLDRLYTLQDLLLMLKKVVLFQSAPKISGAIWFLATLFFVEILYVVIEFIGKKVFSAQISLAMDGISLIIYGISVFATLHGWSDHSGYRLNIVGLSIFLFHIGRKLKTYEQSWDKENPVFVCGIMMAMMFLFIKLGVGRVSYARGDIRGGVYLFSYSMIGWFFLYALSQMLTERESFLQDTFLYIGKHSMPILLMHQISFKIVTLIQVILYKKPGYMLGSFPVLYKENGWWVIYSIVGICVPLLVYEGSRKINIRTIRVKHENIS